MNSSCHTDGAIPSFEMLQLSAVGEKEDQDNGHWTMANQLGKAKRSSPYAQLSQMLHSRTRAPPSVGEFSMSRIIPTRLLIRPNSFLINLSSTDQINRVREREESQYFGWHRVFDNFGGLSLVYGSTFYQEPSNL